ncbi:hypothetical protein WJX73_006907 [Symbiochloris irregularis]|uniref:Protein kinase domain-containing protein n=1 Tax=Symbiochloris irregularis TaxID=706552 RepID=A0AAW1NWE3_9CHLO
MSAVEEGLGGGERDNETPVPRSRRSTLVGVSRAAWKELSDFSRGSWHARVSHTSEVQRLSSLHKALWQNHFLESLPRATKIFLATSALDAMLIMALTIEQLVVGGDLLQILMAMLVTSVFFLWFVVSAIVHENAYELLVTVVLSAVIAVRVLYFVATKNRSPGEVAGAVLAMLLTAACSILALVSYRQFGWRQHSKLACDLRVKNASSRQRSHMLVKRFLALIKLDLQFLIIMFLLGINVATDTGPHQPNNSGLIIANTGGLVLNLLWAVVAYWTVLHEHTRAASALIALLLPCMGMPLVDIILSFVPTGPTAPDTRATMTLSAAVFICVRAGCAVVVLQCVRQSVRQRREHRSPKAKDPATPQQAGGEDIPTELLPLVQGAWIGKPSPGAPKKRRFFQLSADGSTLRWAWDKYIVLYYVADQQNDDFEMEIRLCLLSAQEQPDLLLRFQDQQLYTTWKEGLALTLTLLFSPSGLAPGAHGIPGGTPRLGSGDYKSRGDIYSAIVDSLKHTTHHSTKVSPRRLLRQLSGQISRRSSTSDPENQQFQRIAAAAPALQSPLRSPSAPLRPHRTEDLAGISQPLRRSISRGARSSAAMRKLTAEFDRAEQAEGRQKPAPPLERQLSGSGSQSTIAPALRRQGSREDPTPLKGSPNDSESPGEGAGLRRSISYPPAANMREVVFEQFSPRGLHVRMRITDAQPSSPTDDSTFVLGPPPLPRRAPPPTPYTAPEQSPASSTATASPPQERRPWTPASKAPYNGRPPTTPKLKAALNRMGGKEGSRPAFDIEARADGAAQCHDGCAAAGAGLLSAARRTTGNAAEEVDAQEYLDKVAPLPHSDRPLSKGEELAAAQHHQEGATSLTEVVISQPGRDPLPRQAVGRYPSNDSSTAETVHRRTQNSSSGESFMDGIILDRRHRCNSSSDGTVATVGSYSGSEWSGQLLATDSNLASLPITLKVSVEMIEYDDLSFGKFLGQGAEGSVYAAWYMDTPVAVKQTDSGSEVKMNLAAGSHDNIVALRGLCEHEGKVFLVMEYCPRGTLDLLLHHNMALPWDPLRLLRMVRSIARGMLHLHTRKPPILHRDLKPANIFVGHGLTMKIGDFGMSRHVWEPTPAQGMQGNLERSLTAGTIGTAAYCAPEVLDPASPSPGRETSAQTILKSDVYSFGVLLWETLMRQRPWDGMNGFQIQTRWYMDEDMTLPPVPVPAVGEAGREVLTVLAALVVDCTALNPSQRPTFRTILDRLRPLGSAASMTSCASGPL